MLIENVNINVNCDFLRKKQIWLHVMFQTASDELKEKILIVQSDICDFNLPKLFIL